MSDVDVIVLDLDGGEILDECVDSILQQTTPPSRLIVFDNGSSDPVADRMRRRGLDPVVAGESQPKTGHPPSLVVVRSATNLGFAGGVNAAIAWSEAPFVALVNNDVVLDRDWIESVRTSFRDRDGALQTIIRRNATSIDGAGVDISDGTFRQAGYGSPLGTVPAAWGVSATAAMFRRELVHFDAKFFAWYEDVDLSARIHEAGWSTRVLPIVKATHRGSMTASKLGSHARYLRTRNRYFVARMHPGVGRISALLAEDARLIVQGRSSWRGVIAGLATPIEDARVMRPTRLRVVVITPDVVGIRMAGPGIRALQFARHIAMVAEVTLIAKFGDASRDVLRSLISSDDEIGFVEHGTTAARNALKAADVLIGQPSRGFIRRRRNQRIVYDLFDPVVLELRELYGNAPSPRQRLHVAAEWFRLLRALRSGDLLISASPQQRAFYAGVQSSDVPWIFVPFGVDPSEVKRCEPVRDNLVVWGGGAWAWLDPKLAIDAIVALNREGFRCRLLFLGRSRPDAHTIERRREDRFSQLLDEAAPFVDANPEWVPYRERLSWLRTAKAAIMLHRSTAEAAASIRTRFFDAVAAGVPVIATAGGFVADLVAREHVGIVVPAGDLEAVKMAVHRLMTDDAFYAECVQNLERIRPQFTWERVTRPLVDAVTRWQKQRH